MKGPKQDKKENFEWIRRGQELEQINKVVEAHKSQLQMHDGTDTCYKQLRAILDGYILRCTAASDTRQKYRKKKELVEEE